MGFRAFIALITLRDRSSSVAEHRRACNELERLSPVFKSLPHRGVDVVGLIGLDILGYLQNPFAQIRRGHPCRTGYCNEDDAGTKCAFPPELPEPEETRQHRHNNKGGSSAFHIEDIANEQRGTKNKQKRNKPMCAP